MTKVLVRCLAWSGGAAALVLLVPNIIVFATVGLIFPGFLLALAPTVFLYTVVFSLAWFGLRRFGPTLAVLVGASGVAAVAVGLPTLLNRQATIWQREAAARDRDPVAKIGPVDTIAIELTGQRWVEDGCGDLCQLLLFNGAAKRVIVVPQNADARVRAPTRPNVFRIERRKQCGPTTPALKPDRGFQWTGGGSQIIAKAVRMRIVGGECLTADPTTGTMADVTIRLLGESIGTRPAHLALAPGEVQVKAVEVLRGSEVAARGSRHEAGRLLIPLHLTTYGYGLQLDGWEWARRGTHDLQFDAMPLLRRFTSFGLDTPRGIDPAALRQRIDEALGDSSLAPRDPAFDLVADFYATVTRDGETPGDADRLVRMVADDRVTTFWSFPYKLVRAENAAAVFRNPILDRLLRLAKSAPRDTYRALEHLAGLLPPGSFRETDARIDTLLANPVTRGWSPHLVARLSDQGEAAVPHLVAIVREDYTASASRGDRRPAGGSIAVAAIVGLCRLGPVAKVALPDLRRLAADRLVPKAMTEADTWRVTLARLGADIGTFERPKSRGGTDDQYREHLRRAAARPCEGI